MNKRKDIYSAVISSLSSISFGVVLDFFFFHYIGILTLVSLFVGMLIKAIIFEIQFLKKHL